MTCTYLCRMCYITMHKILVLIISNSNNRADLTLCLAGYLSSSCARGGGGGLFGPPYIKPCSYHFAFLNQSWHVYWPKNELGVFTKIGQKLKVASRSEFFPKNLRFLEVLKKNHRKWAKKLLKIGRVLMNKRAVS